MKKPSDQIVNSRQCVECVAKGKLKVDEGFAKKKNKLRIAEDYAEKEKGSEGTALNRGWIQVRYSRFRYVWRFGVC